MPRYAIFVFGVFLTSLIASGCADSSATAQPTVSATEFQLTSEPAGALEVLDAKGQAKDGEAIIVVGRLGGGVKPWIDGRAAFLLVDTRILPSCNENDDCEDGCPDCAKEMTGASTMVKFLGEDGKVLPIDARDLLGLKEEQTVVIQGLVSRDKTGNVSIIAKGIFIRR